MAVYYLDTSALVKRYVQETGSRWVLEIANDHAGNDLYVSRITGPEMISALFRKVRNGEVDAEDATRAAVDFRADLTGQYQIIEVTEAISNRAMGLAQQRAARGYDAVQLATALELHLTRVGLSLPNLTFISADIALNAMAQSEGLITADPNVHA